METTFVKTSISIPEDILRWVKNKAIKEGHLPVSRLITQAIREKIEREAKAKGGRK